MLGKQNIANNLDSAHKRENYYEKVGENWAILKRLIDAKVYLSINARVFFSWA